MEILMNAIFLDVAPCGSCKNRHSGGTIGSIIRVTRIGELGTSLAVISNRNVLLRLSLQLWLLLVANTTISACGKNACGPKKPRSVYVIVFSCVLCTDL
jgi:hypothetical protein